MKPGIVLPMAHWLVLGTLCVAATTSAWARPPRAREACGVLQSINREAHTLTLIPERAERPLVVEWKGHTKFLKNSKFASPDALKERERACIFYRSPFFGRPSVTKVVWRSETKS